MARLPPSRSIFDFFRPARLRIELDPLRIPLEDLVTATNAFAEENLLKRVREADVYKGLLFGIHVVIHKWISRHYNFYQEIENIYDFKHRNVVSLIGFCDENNEQMIVMEYVANGSLHKHLSDLTCSQRLHICFNVALALRYIHAYKACSYTAKRRFRILLDEDWEAKVFYFLYDPEFEESDDVQYLGEILFEVLLGREETIKDLRQQMDSQSLSIFLETDYNTFKNRYYTQGDESMERLKEALELQWKHENLLWGKDFAHLKISLTRIKLATEDFANTYFIKSHQDDDMSEGDDDMFDEDSMVYKAKLDPSDSNSDLPGKTVIIKRIINNLFSKRNKTTKDFFAEIQMLSSYKHPNLLSLLGFCDEDSEMILVFECDFKETLHDYLASTSKTNYLTWKQRVSICLDIAEGLNHLHIMEDGKKSQSMMHQGILSANVILDKKCTAKIANFRLSNFNSYPISLWQSGHKNFRTWLWDARDAPWIQPNKRLVVDDVYSLGVILFETLTGRLSDDPFYKASNVNGLASMARHHFNEGTLRNFVDPSIMEEVQECSYAGEKGPNQYSFDAYTKIAYQCLAEIPNERPTLEAVIKSLKKALHFQVQNLEHLKIPLKDIKSATENFHQKYLIGSGGYGAVYKAELNHFDIRCSLVATINSSELPKKHSTVAIKRLYNREDGQGKAGFLTELDVLSYCDHPNIVSLLGFCVDDGEMLLVYEHVSNGSLDDYLGSTDNMINIKWAQRLKVCIDIAYGLKYLHETNEDKERIIHSDIKSANILLGNNLEGKIADFGLSRFHPMNQDPQGSTINTNNIVGTSVYIDPEYLRTGRLKKASDIYSFGVVLFEIFSGKLAYHSDYMYENEKGLAPIAQRHFELGTLKEILDPQIMDEAHELSSTVKVGADRDSLNAFSRIAYECLANSQILRPTIKVVIKELDKALQFQENWKHNLKMSLEDIRSSTGNFSDDNCIIIRGGYGVLYRGEIQTNNGHKKVLVKRFSRSGKKHGFLREFEVLSLHKQHNIIGLVGYCNDMDEKIIVYENASIGSLDMYLKDTSFSWSKRLKICIDIAKGLKFLHGGGTGQDVVIHRDLKSSNILLTKDWKAKISGFERALTFPSNQEIDYVMNDVVGSPGYCDPSYWKTHYLTKESDIYSLGVILFEILCGRSACDFTYRIKFLDDLVKHHFQVARVDDIVFDGIKEQIVLESLATFRRIAFRCLHNDREKRPTAGEVLKSLQKALEFQEPCEICEGDEIWEGDDIWEAYEIWEDKLPRNRRADRFNFE